MLFRRILALALALLALLGCSSCASERYMQDKRLEILSPDIDYSESFMAKSATRFVVLAKKAALLYQSANLSREKENAIAEEFTSEILPRLRAIKASEVEIDALLASFEKLLADSQKDANFLSSFLLFYRESALIFGAPRAGEFLYSYALYALEKRESEYRARYLKYGYDFFLSEAEHCRTLSEDLEEILGADGFTNAASICYFLLSFTEGHTRKDAENTLFSLGDADTLALLAYQGEYFKRCNITREGWQTFAALLTLPLPATDASPLSSELYALKKEDYFLRAATACPVLIDFYASFTSRLLTDGQWSHASDESEKERAIALALTESDLPLDECLERIEGALATASTTEKNVLKTHNVQDEFASFLESHAPITRQELIDALQRKASGDQTVPALSSLFLAYSLSCAPYLTFVLCHSAQVYE